MNRKVMSVMFVVATMCVLQSARAETVYSLATGFSATVNTDTSTWSYRYQANGSPNNQARDGNYELLPDTAATNKWYLDSGTYDLPLVEKPITVVQVHPGIDQLVAISWLAPGRGNGERELPVHGPSLRCW